jgi:hypothetical protein
MEMNYKLCRWAIVLSILIFCDASFLFTQETAENTTEVADAYPPVYLDCLPCGY